MNTTMTTPTIDRLADHVAYHASNSVTGADIAREIASEIRENGGASWVRYGRDEVIVYDLTGMGLGDRWNGIVMALDNELHALEYGIDLEYSDGATPLTDSTTRTAEIREQLVRGGDEKIATTCQRVRDAYIAGEPLDSVLAQLELLIVARGVVKGA